ncbi:MAG TPA: hypothetical protein VJ044_14920, partial [Candidatus Hodarchaeales archaeon]|nr:hypothetical protein [Candidatus Hodarchaeales archaeon]
ATQPRLPDSIFGGTCESMNWWLAIHEEQDAPTELENLGFVIATNRTSLRDLGLKKEYGTM